MEGGRNEQWWRTAIKISEDAEKPFALPLAAPLFESELLLPHHNHVQYISKKSRIELQWRPRRTLNIFSVEPTSSASTKERWVQLPVIAPNLQCFNSPCV